MKLNQGLPTPYSRKMKMTIDSNRFFNDPQNVKDLESMGYEVEARDVFGGFVPQDKNKSDNLKETEEHIRNRFSLNAGGSEDGDE